MARCFRSLGFYYHTNNLSVRHEIGFPHLKAEEYRFDHMMTFIPNAHWDLLGIGKLSSYRLCQYP